MNIFSPVVDVEKEIFTIKVKLNGVEQEIETDDLKETIQSLKPKYLKTKVLMTITRESDSAFCQRIIFVQRAKMMWRNENYLDLFIKSISFKPYGQG